ncbi:MAG TPA: hypothetical protein VD902_22610 [Symbiobacteriaceae bacterium]|nr:hypothetical protein [Symbiobacteriaceae bacterium]
MKLNNKLGIVAGALLISGSLLTGAAFAAGDTDANPAKAVAAAKATLSEGAQAVRTQLGDLRKAAMEKLQADSKALVDQAVAEGKITQEEADRMLRPVDKRFRVPGKLMMKHPGGGKAMFHFDKDMTQEELQAKLDTAVKDGKMTQEQADKMLKFWTERQSLEK